VTAPHWTAPYVGKPWDPGVNNCYEWFRRVQSEHFGRRLDAVPIDPDRLVAQAAKALAGNVPRGMGWQPTDRPEEGDAAFLSQGARPHHIGVVARIDEGLCILHAADCRGVVLSPLASLRTAGWRVMEYWTCR
jgi:hypothetical protein